MNQATLDPMTMVLHELRAPLGLMATAAQAAADDCQDDDLRMRCEMIVRAAERMLRTANQVFHLHDAAHAEERVRFRPFDVVSELADSLGGLRPGVNIDAGWEARAAACEGDRARFEALVHSLVSNAIDHAPSGTPIRLRLSMAAGALEMAISNQTPSSPCHRGLGLGTTIADGLAERLGATVVREISAGVFRVRLALPLAPA